MAKKLSQLSTQDMREQMSIAGSPEKITNLMTEIEALIAKTIDVNNPAELINTAFALDRLKAEIKLLAGQLGKRNGQKYIIK